MARSLRQYVGYKKKMLQKKTATNGRQSVPKKKAEAIKSRFIKRINDFLDATVVSPLFMGFLADMAYKEESI